MKVLITGARGMVARAAIEHCRSIGDDVISASREDLDIGDKNAVFDLINAHRPDAILNCAAYTNVDGAETEQGAAFAANSTGVENLALAARETNSAFLTISTDYVFDGENSGFYTQRDTPVPISAYGRSKLQGEIAARNAYARSIIVRSGWIFGPGGRNFLSLMPALLAAGKQIKAIHDSYGTPTYAADLARRMRQLIELDLPCIFHVTNHGGGTSYKGFAEKVCELGGYDRRLLESVSVNDLGRPAPRPISSKLECLFSKKLGLEPLPDWESALESYLKKLKASEAAA